MYTDMQTYIYAYMFTQSVPPCQKKGPYIYICTHIHINIYMHTHTHIYTHITEVRTHCKWAQFFDLRVFIKE